MHIGESHFLLSYGLSPRGAISGCLRWRDCGSYLVCSRWCCSRRPWSWGHRCWGDPYSYRRCVPQEVLVRALALLLMMMAQTWCRRCCCDADPADAVTEAAGVFVLEAEGWDEAEGPEGDLDAADFFVAGRISPSKGIFRGRPLGLFFWIGSYLQSTCWLMLVIFYFKHQHSA